MTSSEYQALPAVNWSLLRELRRSPLHYQHALTVEREDTDALRLGRAVHTAVLEPDRFALDYAVWQGGRRSGNEWAHFCMANHTRTILTLDQYTTACAIRDAVRSHPVASPYLSRGEPEVVLRWRHEKTGLDLKGRADWISDTAIVDLKTSRHAISPRQMSATVHALGYHCQLALYRAGVKAMTDRELPAVMIAVEPAAPHDVAVYAIMDEALFAGEEEVEELLALLKECRATDSWRGRFSAVQELDLPRYAYPSDDDGDPIEDPSWILSEVA